MDLTTEPNISALPQKWQKAISRLDFAFQPIIHPLTAQVHAMEALIRGTYQAGFPAIDDFYNAAFHEDQLFNLEKILRERAIAKFVQIPFYREIKLFYNYDHRIHMMDNYKYGVTEGILNRHNLPNRQFCFELSEKHKYEISDYTRDFLKKTKNREFMFAIDDFGAGFSGLELFYNTEPDYIKFDRFLISNIHHDPKKKAFSSHLIKLAKTLGVMVIGEGVETLEEFTICREMGFDLIQGFFASSPTLDTNKLTLTYPHILERSPIERFTTNR